MLDIKQNLAQKQNLHLSLKLWLPILQSGGDELEKTVEQICLENPYLEMSNSKMISSVFDNKKGANTFLKTKNRLESDAFVLEKDDSFYTYVEKQIDSHIFPTEFSRKIALEILENINEDGFFDGNIHDIALKFDVTSEKVENIRQRFRFLEPIGVGARDLKESFLFQLDAAPASEELYELTRDMILNFGELDRYVARSGYKEALKIIKGFSYQPAIEFFEDSARIAPDVTVEFRGEELDVRVDNFYGFELSIVEAPKSGDFSKEKYKEAKEISGLLALRKTTLHNIATIIAQKQFKFFCGGAMTPMKMQEVADMLGFNQSTISRAVANKYIACDRGVFAMKDFFSSSLGDDVAPFEIKEFIKKNIESENRAQPISDEDMQVMVQKKFGIEIVRRTITKYRDELGLSSSKERKKYYRLCA